MALSTIQLFEAFSLKQSFLAFVLIVEAELVNECIVAAKLNLVVGSVSLELPCSHILGYEIRVHHERCLLNWYRNKVRV